MNPHGWVGYVELAAVALAIVGPLVLAGLLVRWMRRKT